MEMMGNKEQHNKLVEQLSTLWGIGRWPRFPGTWGSVAALPLAFLVNQLNLLAAATVTFLVILFAIYICHLYEKNRHEHDSSEVVIDEVAGLLVAALGVQGWWFLVAFVLFRFFDILKPPPISTIDQKVSGGFGVVLDDVAAGLIANALIHFVLLGAFHEQINQLFG